MSFHHGLALVAHIQAHTPCPRSLLDERSLIAHHLPRTLYIYNDGVLSLNGVFEAACIIAVFPLVVWYAASGKTTDEASTRICRFLGDISYPLYIVHYPIMYAFYMWLIKTRLYTLHETWPMALAAVTASIILAWLCLKLYDYPVRKWLRNL